MFMVIVVHGDFRLPMYVAGLTLEFEITPFTDGHIDNIGT